MFRKKITRFSEFLWAPGCPKRPVFSPTHRFCKKKPMPLTPRRNSLESGLDEWQIYDAQKWQGVMSDDSGGWEILGRFVASLLGCSWMVWTGNCHGFVVEQSGKKFHVVEFRFAAASSVKHRLYHFSRQSSAGFCPGSGPSTEEAEEARRKCEEAELQQVGTGMGSRCSFNGWV